MPVSWLPKGDGPSPEFVGTLSVEKCRRDDCFGLVLSGQYTPLGASSGGARGNQIVRVPAGGVLRAIADYVLRRALMTKLRSLATADMLANDGAFLRAFLEDSRGTKATIGNN